MNRETYAVQPAQNEKRVRSIEEFESTGAFRVLEAHMDGANSPVENSAAAHNSSTRDVKLHEPHHRAAKGQIPGPLAHKPEHRICNVHIDRVSTDIWSYSKLKAKANSM
ncbi:hypothetical protein CRM22_010821 [Opisthorchis felineus]|uniref:Uncharacterized protein n=1 Tax=Opisthorchis felineus TaxID=147828 RepID=A0A4S2KMA2_OPIFE|nr:hypothetical protein CRM22_010821 [Opisthorchis felineus]